jgi:hypothetical protein
MDQEEEHIVIEYINQDSDPDYLISIMFLYGGLIFIGVSIFGIIIEKTINPGILIVIPVAIFFFILALTFWPIIPCKIMINNNTISFNKNTSFRFPNPTVSIEIPDISLVRIKKNEIQIETKNNVTRTINTEGAKPDDRERLIDFFKRKRLNITDQQKMIDMLTIIF